MVQVGKIVTREADYTRFNSTSERYVAVSMTQHSVQLSIHDGGSESVGLTPEQAIELGQMLLKAAECQPEYAEADKTLDEERAKLNMRYKDTISGLGLETEIDVVDARGTFKVIEAS